MRPSSAQRCSCREHLAGIEQRVGIEGALDALLLLQVVLVNIDPIRSRFSTPTPCSPVSTPPTSTQSLRMSAPKSSARSSSPGLLAS
jgi:hypothetical protein